MLFRVIERFKQGNPKRAGERFKERGRMLPEGVTYLASWMDSTGARCFQVLDAPDRESLTPWMDRWNDLVDFEIVPVRTSTDFWSEVQFE